MMSNDTVIASLKEKIDDLNQQAWEARVSDSPRAFQLSEESVHLARSINYSKGLAEGLRSLGFCYVRLFKNDEAAPLLRESLSLFQSLNDLSGQAIVYEYLGIIERNWGNLGASLELLLKGNELVRQTGPLEVEVTCCYQLGVTYKHLGNHDLALDYLYKSLSLSKEINLKLMEGYAINIIGSIYFDNGNYKDALDCYQQGLVIRQESHDKWGEAGSLDNIGFTYLKLNDLDKAIDYCKQSLQITQSTDDKKGEANTLLHLAEIYKQAGDIGQASKFSNESLTIRKLRGDKRGEAEVLLFNADLNKSNIDIEDRQIFEWISTALNIADEIKAQDLLSKAYFNLHEYYSRKGNHKESLVHLEAHLRIEKELHKNAINQKVQNLEISYKAEEIKKEAEAEKLRNKELTELNEQIEKVSEELKIEASLERVRTTAMAMKEPADMLNVCRTISDQLLQLGFKEIRNVQTVIIYPQKHEYINYQYFTPYDKSTVEIIDYRLHPDVLDFTEQMLSSPNAYYTKTFEGEELKVWREYRKQTNQLHDPKLDEATSSHYYFYSIGSGALGVTTYAPLSENEIGLFKRFRNVFELAYRRFVDIEKAQAQAREAQIEAALERVRAKSMAMHHSEDLISVINVVQEQMLGLGFHFHGANFVTDYSEKGYTMWLASPGESFPFKIYVPQIGQKFFEAVKEAIENGSDFATYTLNFEEKNIYFKNLFENSLAKNTSEEGKRKVYDSKGMAASVVLLDKIRLNLMNLDLIPFTDEENNILKRFGYVFEQSYTRFLDLQKAEAQAREAQIEAALERVRSKTMAMHKSEEVTGVAVSLNEELLKLGFKGGSTIIIIDKETGDTEQWTGFSENKFLKSCYVPYFKHPCHDALLNGWKKGEKFLVYTVAGEEKRSLDEHYFSTGYKDFPETDKSWMRQMESVIFSHAFTKYGAIHWGPGHLTEEQLRILQRFSIVFEQSYTRFLDLQKAEAQTKEAQTEVALERIRARAMAMHSSNELMDVAHILREQMGMLGQPDLETSVVNLFEEDSALIFSWNASRVPGSSEKIISTVTSFAKNSSELTREMMSLYHSGEKEYTLEAAGLKLMEFLKVLIKANPRVADYMGSKPPEKVFYHFTTFTGGNLLTVSYQPPSEETKSLQRRAASVFDMAYRRYLDLKKAEAQAREAHIEAALERVRSRSMGMHKSDELREVVGVLFAQLQHLGIDIKFCSIALIDKLNSTIEFWLAGFSQEILPESYHVPNLDHSFYRNFQDVFQQGIPYHVFELSGEEKRSYDKLWFTLTDFKKLPERVKKPMMEMERVVLSCAFTKNGMIQIGGFEPISDRDASIVQRFAKVFEQTHTRFLDLQKAEAQAREAQIEAALERVRAKVMAMTNSTDLNETSLVFGEQLRKLGIAWQFSYFWLIEEAKNENTFWITWPDNKTSFTKYTLAEAEEYFNDCLISWRAGVKIHDNYVPPQSVKDWLDTFQRIAEDAGGEAKKIMVPQTFANGVYYYDAMMKYGSFGICISKPATDEEKKIQCRFAIEFERAYTRFLDLKQAEAQTRESQIELGLERVRARAMAMQRSDELAELVDTVFKELTKLHFTLDRCIIIIIDENSRSANYWMANPESITPTAYHLQLKDIPLLNATFNAWKERIPKMVYDLEGDEKSSTVEYIFSKTELKLLPAEVREGMKNTDRIFLNISFNNFGGLQADTIEPLTEENLDILYRFSKVFDLTYTRFNDLRQAEAQTREAQIELGLERVRARAMAMQNSGELKELIATVSTELSKLDLILDRCFIMTYDIKTLGVTWWMANPETPSEPIDLYVKYHEQIPYLAFLKAWQDRIVKFQYILEGSVKKTWDEFLFVETELSRLPRFVIDNMRANDKVYLSASFNNFGCLTLATLEPLSDEQFDIMLRFAKVFDLTYTRFNDLKQAEAQARAAKIEAALERVRARALAMQEPEELKDVAHVLRTEMGLLGVEELETCSIYINDLGAEQAECWYALKDAGSAEMKLVNDHFALNLNDTWVGREMLQFYNADTKQISIVMTGDNRKEWIQYCEQNSIPLRGYYGAVIPDRTYHLYKFSHGAIGVATPGEISAESWDLLKRAASVFSLAYSRFKDLTQARTDLIKLKEEKKRAEDALTELQVTQKQLIQSEKMASLGELTAGIAHEIQNPLNFVNNFSDVSNELLEEMKTELATGNTQQAIEMVNAVKDNLEKILHHGQRADAIVKSMLQHSRSSTGKKEPTDINSLAEEYFRLAFHGLRAKDKSFNAKFETDLDKSIGKVNIISQDVGRVILNLINNAFYAVNEKKNKNANGYDPVVAVSTRKVNDKVEIKVKDNGDGIPQKVLDKIFQPFFTTKPTGQGTGLGLSLSYDIITKGHGGELFVKTKEGEGTEFIISLPVN